MDGVKRIRRGERKEKEGRAVEDKQEPEKVMEIRGDNRQPRKKGEMRRRGGKGRKVRGGT